MTPSAKRRLLLLASTLAGAAGPLATISCSSGTPRPVAVAPVVRDVPQFLRGTVGSESTLNGTTPTLVSGYGLVVGLNGTGGQPLPDRIAATMEREMGLQGIGKGGDYEGFAINGKSPREVLQDPAVCVVKVTASIPPGSPSGSTFDVFVQAVNASSLEGGRLWTTDLRIGEAAPLGAVQTQKIAVARGEVFINPFIDPEGSDDGVTRTKGRVLDGGRMTQPLKIEMLLDNESHSRARAIVSAVNSRFGEMPGDLGPVAVGRNSSSIAIQIPSRYRKRPNYFLEMLLAVQIDQGAPEEYARRYVSALKEEPYLAFELSFCLEALGPKAIPFIRDLYDYSELAPRLAALRAGAGLGDTRTVPHLMREARQGAENIRTDAIALLAEIDGGPTIDLALRDLLTEPGLGVRIAAYEGLARRAEKTQLARLVELQKSPSAAAWRDEISFDRLEAMATAFLPGGSVQGVRRQLVERRFLLDVVPFGDPMIYITQQGTPRVVVFGSQAGLVKPLLTTAWNNRFQMVADTTSSETRLYYADPRTGERVTMTAPDQLPDLIEALGRRNAPDDPRPGLGLSYAGVVGVLYAIHQTGATDAAFATEQDRLSAELLSARRASKLVDRPETPDDKPEVIVFEQPVRPTELDRGSDARPPITPIDRSQEKKRDDGGE